MERHRFDLWLKSLIPPPIHTFHRAYFKGMKQEGGLYSISFRQEIGEREESCTQQMNINAQFYTCKARIVIGADGAKSHIRHLLYPQLKTKSLV